MTDYEFIFAVIAIAGGIGLTFLIFDNIFKLIKTWMKGRNNLDEETFDRLAQAFMKHKKDSERRFRKLEAIIAGDEKEGALTPVKNSKKVNALAKSIEIEDRTPGKEDGRESQNSNLRNMLRE